MRHAATHAQSACARQRCEMSEEERRGLTQRATSGQTHCARQHGRCGEVGHSCHLYEPLDAIWKILSDRVLLL